MAVSIGALSFAAALGLAAGALDVLFSALPNMTPMVARQDLPPRSRCFQVCAMTSGRERSLCQVSAREESAQPEPGDQTVGQTRPNPPLCRRLQIHLNGA